ncbi:MAG: hypothetical protein IPJ04_12665 [Candidatus Eisenbacteria bacterium]|nr:hypothetical protein [Candidatus Eisenbacteria bacterium]
MAHLNEWFPYVVVALSALSSVASLLPAPGGRNGLKSFAHVALFLAAAAFVVSLAHPALLPPSSIAMQANGSSQDPRIVGAVALALAAYLALLPALQSLQLPALGFVGSLLPGLAIGGVAVSLFYFMQVRSPLVWGGLLLAGLTLGQIVGLAPRLMRLGGMVGTLVLAAGCALLVGAGMLSLHGARAPETQIIQGGTLDTLGLHFAFTGTQEPAKGSRQLLIAVGADSTVLRPMMSGGASDSLTSVADAKLLGGPVIVPLALHEMRRKQPHGIAWIKKGESFDAGRARVKFLKYRIEMEDSVRVYADIEVTSDQGTETLSPGWTAHDKGEVPFAAASKAMGPISVAGMDADNGRVALMFSSVEPPASHVALVDIRLRPALELAWIAAIVALVGLLLSLSASPAVARRG